MEAYVTSSGTTNGLETYDFDVFTNEIFIQGVFSADAQTMAISEASRCCSCGFFYVLVSEAFPSCATGCPRCILFSTPERTLAVLIGASTVRGKSGVVEQDER